jgi:6-methylsalicylate decarboxylase
MNLIVPHGGGALPLLADRIKAFLSATPSPHDSAPDPVAQLRRLYYDLAGTPFPR